MEAATATATAEGDSSPLFEKIVENSLLDRCYAVIHISLFLCFLVLRILKPIEGFWGIWSVAFACEACFAFNWILEHNLRWFFVRYQTYIDRFDRRYSAENAIKLPAVDVIITAADIKKESPIVSMNTVLSVLALDYPTQKFACYVSDDGASPILYYSLLETLSFAEKWIPFCRKYNLETRAPFAYFDREEYLSSCNGDLIMESNSMKEYYEELKRKIGIAMETGFIPTLHLDAGLASKDSEVANHSSIVKIIHEHSGNEDILPHLIYVAREKRPKVKHHFKAGAMNTMVRVSGLMTNAPYILNLDCDMFVNNCKVIRHAMCFFLDCKSERDFGYVQFPQSYYSSKKDNNPWATQLKDFERLIQGTNGLEGPLYCGTGCFHRRKTVYGSPPDCKGFISSWSHGDFTHNFGESNPLMQSTINAFKEVQHCNSNDLSATLADALKLTSCSYEVNTSWGKEIGWKYGSIAEDLLTGLSIHSLGWRSVGCMPETVAFMGCAPSSIQEASIQQRRWISGLLNIEFSAASPWLGWSSRKLSIRQRMVYFYFTRWGITGVAAFCYAVVPTYSLLTQKPSMPKLMSLHFIIGAIVFLQCYGLKLWQSVKVGGSIQEWWQLQRTLTINCYTSWLFGAMDVILEMLKLTEMVFEVTAKSFPDGGGKFEGDVKHNPSYLNVPPTTLLLMSMVAITFKSFGIIFDGQHAERIMMVEYLGCCWTILCLWPFLKALLRKELPTSVVAKSTFIAFLVCSCLLK